jgi:hypothetical protein
MHVDAELKKPKKKAELIKLQAGAHLIRHKKG